MEEVTKRPNGRPTKMTQETIEVLERAFSIGCTDVEACLQAGISRTTLDNYQNKTEGFVDRKEQLKSSLVLKSREVIQKSLESGNIDTAKWYAERKRSDEFSTKTVTQQMEKVIINDNI